MNDMAKDDGAKPYSTKAAAAFIFGMFAILFSPSIVMGLLFGIIAVAIAATAKGEKDIRHTKAGKITGIIGMILSGVFLFYSIYAGVAAYRIFDAQQVDTSVVTQQK